MSHLFFQWDVDDMDTAQSPHLYTAYNGTIDQEQNIDWDCVISK